MFLWSASFVFMYRVVIMAFCKRTKHFLMHVLIFNLSNWRVSCLYKPEKCFNCQSTNIACVRNEWDFYLLNPEWPKELLPLHYFLSVPLTTVLGHLWMNGWRAHCITPETVTLPNRATHSLSCFLSPHSKLLICPHHNLMNAQCTSVSSTLHVCMYTWKTAHVPHGPVTFITPILPLIS